MSDWHLYLVRTPQDTIYTGVTTDVDRRLREHEASGCRGARYLQGRGSLRLLYQVRIGEQSLALRLEHAVKRLTRHRKEILVASAPARHELLQYFNMAN